jgi:hypothetical protein
MLTPTVYEKYRLNHRDKFHDDRTENEGAIGFLHSSSSDSIAIIK